MDEKNSETPDNSAPAAAPAAAKAEAKLAGVPSTWPGAFGAYKYSKQAVKLNLGTLVVIWLAVAIITGIGDSVMKSAGGLVSLLVGSLAAACYALTYLAGVRGQRLSISDAVNKGLPFWLKMIGLNILIGFTLVVSFILLVIPFLIVMPRLVLANYFLVDKNLGVMDAYKASWAATKGHAMTVWGIIGAGILMALLMVTIIGIPFSIYFLVMYSGVLGVLYEFLNKSQPATA